MSVIETDAILYHNHHMFRKTFSGVVPVTQNPSIKCTACKETWCWGYTLCERGFFFCCCCSWAANLVGWYVRPNRSWRNRDSIFYLYGVYTCSGGPGFFICRLCRWRRLRPQKDVVKNSEKKGRFRLSTDGPDAIKPKDGFDDWHNLLSPLLLSTRWRRLSAPGAFGGLMEPDRRTLLHIFRAGGA